jgi:tRNA (guanosine-2'-O-)-methyltransferase
VKPLRDTDVKRLNREWRRRTEGRVALLLDGVQNPFNVGTIVRTAAAMRVEHLYLSAATAPSHPKVGKTALGSERYLTWSDHPTIVDALGALRDDGFAVVGVELAAGAVPLVEARLGDAVCFALGHEDRGLSAACLAACDEVAYIPQLGRVGSLNVAQAAAIAVYEARRREWAGARPHGSA